jgi:hypothetical protein
MEKRFTNRKLTKADGERILWHTLFYMLDHYATKDATYSIRTLLRDHFVPICGTRP